MGYMGFLLTATVRVKDQIPVGVHRNSVCCSDPIPARRAIRLRLHLLSKQWQKQDKHGLSILLRATEIHHKRIYKTNHHINRNSNILTSTNINNSSNHNDSNNNNTSSNHPNNNNSSSNRCCDNNNTLTNSPFSIQPSPPRQPGIQSTSSTYDNQFGVATLYGTLYHTPKLTLKLKHTKHTPTPGALDLTHITNTTSTILHSTKANLILVNRTKTSTNRENLLDLDLWARNERAGLAMNASGLTRYPHPITIKPTSLLTFLTPRVLARPTGPT